VTRCLDSLPDIWLRYGEQGYIPKVSQRSDADMRINFAEGAAITILVPLVFLLVGILSPRDTLTAILLLFGAWSLVFGILMAIAREKMYYVSWGAILMALSPIAIIPLKYTIALVIVVVILLIVATIVMRQRRPAAGPQGPGQG
jgi:membrane-bound ClpP family serine protease